MRIPPTPPPLHPVDAVAVVRVLRDSSIARLLTLS